MPVSVIIPALNEEPRIANAILSAFLAGAAEVIVADGGSSDATVEIARAHDARILTGTDMRSRLLNLGAREATHDTLLFLHADTLLPLGAAAAVETAIADGVVFGGFRVAFLEPYLGPVAWMINTRTRLTRKPRGNQAQFTTRAMLSKLGGYPEIPILEDYELARRMKRAGRTTILPLTVRTSGRRFLDHGVVRTTALTWILFASYHLGISPARLARWYRR